MKSILLIAALTITTFVAGCATVDGIGRDISGGANRVSNWVN